MKVITSKNVHCLQIESIANRIDKEGTQFIILRGSSDNCLENINVKLTLEELEIILSQMKALKPIHGKY